MALTCVSPTSHRGLRSGGHLAHRSRLLRRRGHVADRRVVDDALTQRWDGLNRGALLSCCAARACNPDRRADLPPWSEIMSTLRIVVATSWLAEYPQGGGIWAWILHYLNGLRDLGHKVFLIDRMHSSTRPVFDTRRIAILRERLKRLGLTDHWAVICSDKGTLPQRLEDYTVYGASETRLRDIIRDADLLWNLAGALPWPLLSSFKRTVLLDGDPGQLQISSLSWDMKLDHHHVLFTAGTKVNDRDCEIPRLGLSWQSFLPPIYLPSCQPDFNPDHNATVTSVTQWNWANEFRLKDRVLSDSKRDAYLRYVRLPTLSRRMFTLAANIDPRDKTGDVDLLKANGWNLVHPHHVARTPKTYIEFIKHSLCEFGCAKPIYVDLRTGWFSERSATYLACGRPVIVENTGFSDHIKTGRGLLTFSNLEEAASSIDSVMTDYSLHSRAARELAVSCFSSARVLPKMIEASFGGKRSNTLD